MKPWRFYPEGVVEHFHSLKMGVKPYRSPIWSNDYKLRAENVPPVVNISPPPLARGTQLRKNSSPRAHSKTLFAHATTEPHLPTPPTTTEILTHAFCTTLSLRRSIIPRLRPRLRWVATSDSWISCARDQQAHGGWLTHPAGLPRRFGIASHPAPRPELRDTRSSVEGRRVLCPGSTAPSIRAACTSCQEIEIF